MGVEKGWRRRSLVIIHRMGRHVFSRFLNLSIAVENAHVSTEFLFFLH